MLPYVLIATGAGLAGGALAMAWCPRIGARSAVQHFTAGLVIAAVATGLLPEIEREGNTVGVIFGFAAGGAAMILLKWVVVRHERRSRERTPVGLAAAATADTLIDGAIIGASFSGEAEAGALIAIALAAELFF